MTDIRLPPGERMRRLTNPIINPIDEPRIEVSGQYALVECAIQYLPHEVMQFVERKHEGAWIMAIWKNVVDGEEIIQGNPHLNERGKWVWRLVKA